MDDKFSVGNLSILFARYRSRYFPDYDGYVDPSKFDTLSLVLRQAKIDPSAYFHFVFGIEERFRPPTPKSLCSSLLIQKYRSMTYRGETA